uniref:Endoplasmic reticulum-Golgi intermediate compartment protein n=1 Tax=Astatotilapia calliptera TaxID=8154 RepID=A0A3P8QJC8_ASTCA
MRRLSRKKALSLVKELDAFPKVSESYVETSASGGTVSLIAFSAMALLAVLEFFVYRETWMKYEYSVDKDFSSKLRINIDINSHVGADILDLAETMITSNGLQYEPVIFELTPQQRLWQRTLLLIQNRLREEHALQEVLYKTLLKGAPTALHHGQSPMGNRFSHLCITAYNFSHRIDHLSFGEELPGVINPLDGTEKITYNSKSHDFRG